MVKRLEDLQVRIDGNRLSIIDTSTLASDALYVVVASFEFGPEGWDSFKDFFETVIAPARAYVSRFSEPIADELSKDQPHD